jgi:hypothetical protein
MLNGLPLREISHIILGKKAFESVTNLTFLFLLLFTPFAIFFFRKLCNFRLLRVITFLVRSNTCTITKLASELHRPWQSNSQANY